MVVTIILYLNKMDEAKLPEDIFSPPGKKSAADRQKVSSNNSLKLEGD
jgi:hypothetical protein